MSSFGGHAGKCEFEVAPYVCELTGGLEATLFEVGGAPPTGVIRTDQEWGVKVDWYLKGHLLHHLCGKFCICLYIECIGGGVEKMLACEYVPFDPCGNGQYSTTIKVLPGIIPSGEGCGQVCCLAVTLTSIDPCDQPGHIAAYCKGPCVMFALPPHGG